ncbi:hypothetical protein AAAV89_05280 [Enterococcus asini]|uniref:WD40/YVTN/BNR-like repeat-containing protein n=1 Tax=Enterococcus asini TaxID=57732 RepID=UPI0032C17139
MAHPFRRTLYSFLVVAATGASLWQAWQSYEDQPPLSSTTKTPQGPQSELPNTVTAEPIAYTLQNKKLYLTFDSGANWQQVPATMAEFFGGEYATANSNELLPDSYLLTQARSGFLIIKENRLVWLETKDQGASWQEYPIADVSYGLRFRQIQFLDDNFAVCVLSGGRAMGQEGAEVLLSHDAGKTWTEVPATGLGNGMLVTDAGFISPEVGFVSRKNQLYVTQDGGNSFSLATVVVPEKYEKIFVWPEAPYLEGDKLYLRVNQGDSGDYAGGLVKGLFASTDQGKTFTFVRELTEQEVAQ